MIWLANFTPLLSAAAHGDLSCNLGLEKSWLRLSLRILGIRLWCHVLLIPLFQRFFYKNQRGRRGSFLNRNESSYLLKWFVIVKVFCRRKGNSIRTIEKSSLLAHKHVRGNMKYILFIKRKLIHVIFKSCLVRFIWQMLF